MQSEPSTPSMLSAIGWWTTCAVLAASAIYGGVTNETFLGFLTVGLAAALCAPVVQDRLRTLLNTELAPRALRRIVVVLSVLGLFFMAAGDIAIQDEANRQRTEEQAQARADAESEFQAHKAGTVASIKAKRDAGRYEDALTEIARYATVSSDPVLAQLKTSVEEAARQTEVAACMASLAEKQVQYSSLFQQARFEEAAEVLKRCSVVTNAPELQEKVAAALAQPYVRVLDDKNATLQEKQSALRSLDSISKAIAEPYQQVVRNLELKEEERLAAAERKRKKSEGVAIGMSKEDVLASSWGAPERINRTTTSYGVREQWVYGSRNYLYFQNDVLVTIQN